MSMIEIIPPTEIRQRLALEISSLLGDTVPKHSNGLDVYPWSPKCSELLEETVRRKQFMSAAVLILP